MNLNVWNIKDLFSIPPGTGTSKSSGKNSNGEHSSLTDSQFLFGSQYCPDNSQPSPSENRQSQHNSQDSEPSVFLKYQSKPSLYGDGKEKGSFKFFGMGKNKGLSEQFEESKKKAKEKLEIDHLNNLISSIQQTIQEIKMAFCQTEETTNLRCKAIMESIEALAKGLQDTTASNCESILKAVSAKCNMEEALLDLEKKNHTNDGDLATTKCNVELILTNMDALKSQQSEQQVILSEKVGWLSDYVKSLESKILCKLEKIHVPKFVLSIKDNTTQTSPSTYAQVSLKDHTEQLEPKETCADASLCSQYSGPCSCSATVSADLSENMNSTGSAPATKSCNPGSLDSVRNLPSGSQLANVSMEGPQQLNMGTLDLPPVMSVEKENIVGKSIPNYSHISQSGQVQENDLTMSNVQKGTVENIGSSCGEEPRLPQNKARKTARSRNRATANKHKISSKKKRLKYSTKSNRNIIYGNLANISQVKSGDISVISDWDESLTDLQRKKITLLSDSPEASLPVIHAPVRKAQYKAREKYSLLASHQTVQQQSSSKDLPLPGYSVGQYNSESVHWDFSMQESEMLQYTIRSENPKFWLCPSSPLLDNSQAHPVLPEEDNDALCLFFDSSDETN